jgi:DNA invertase Pin-like site-specific DNA recombinase
MAHRSFLERPALKRFLAGVATGKIDVIVVYKIDRLSRSMLDFLNLVELLERHGVTFVSVTQLFNTKDAMGRMRSALIE